MTKEERKARERAERADYILNSAEKLMMARGFENIKIEDIAEESGYAKRTIYLYFKDRGSIYYSLVHRGQKLLLLALSAASEEISRNGDLIGHFCRAFYNFSLAHPAYFEMVMKYESMTNLSLDFDEKSDDPESLCAEMSRHYGTLILECLVEDMEKNQIRSDLTPRQLLLLLWSQIFGFMQVLLTRRDRFSEVYEIEPENFLDHFIRAISLIYTGKKGKDQ